MTAIELSTVALVAIGAGVVTAVVQIAVELRRRPRSTPRHARRKEDQH